jgi:putative heme-binding domain-containing protein
VAPLVAQRGDAPDARPRPAVDQLARFHLPPGFAIQLVAAEPDLGKPLNLAFDAAGRLWVTTTRHYPWPARTDALGRPIADFTRDWEDNHLAFRGLVRPPEPETQARDQLIVLSAFDPVTGRAGRAEVFADGLNIPVGVTPLPRAPGSRGDAVIVHSIPGIWRLEDTDGDGRADRRELLYSGFGFKDTHGMASSFTPWLDGWIYATHGFANRSEIRDLSGRVTKLESGNTFRFRADGSRLEPWAHGQTNPFGLAFDARGDVYTADSHSKPVYLLLRGGYYEGINRQHDGLGFAPSITQDSHGSSAIAGVAVYAATQFPEEYRGNLFNGNPVTRRVNRARLEWTGSTPKAVRQADFLTCDDPAFRPVQVVLGPDGALWIADFYNPIIGHYEVPLTHPARNRTHGRIWRVFWRGDDATVPAPGLPDLARAAAPALAAALRDSNLAVRMLAANELTGRVAPQDARAALHTTSAPLPLGAALPVALLCERLGASDEAALFAALEAARGADDEAALASLRAMLLRAPPGPAAFEVFRTLLSRVGPGHVWRAVADLFARHPQPWQTPLLLSMLARAPDSDPLLVYGLRLALKAHVAAAPIARLTELAEDRPEDAVRLADVAVAVATPAAAEFLLGHLERVGVSGSRAGEFARHAVRQLGPGNAAAVETLIRKLEGAPLGQRLALAEGLAEAAGKELGDWPTAVSGWLERTLLAALAAEDVAVARRGAQALKPLALPPKNAPLRARALDPRTPAALRQAALEAFEVDAEGEAALARILNSEAGLGVRRAAAERLAKFPAGAVARRALAAALPAAGTELAILVAGALAQSEDGASTLVALVGEGRAPASLLRHGRVAPALAKRAAGVRGRVAELTRDLPGEDARLDAVIAARIGAYGEAKRDPRRGAEVFVAHCAACHRRGDVGGNVGPNLDGLAARGLGRVVEDILDPGRNVDPLFRLASVTLRDGEVRSGFNPRRDPAGVTLADPATGRDFRIASGEIARFEPTGASAMPAGFETSLPERDFLDLLAFVLGQ